MRSTQVKFSKHDLGYLKGGEVVEVNLSGNAANVRLLDASNLSSFKAGRSHRAIGGLMTKSPAHFKVPHSGHWYVTVDMVGLRGSVRSSVNVLPRAMPPLRQTNATTLPSSLVRDISHEVAPQTIQNDPKTFDVFISHASEDKDAIVRPLAHALVAEGLNVWYDEFELRIGDSLRRKIDKGLANSRFGIVVLAESFFKKDWPNYELDGLVTKGVSGEQVLLPIWHGITKAQVVAFSPSLADKVARNTTVNTIEEIAIEIADRIRGE
jgi:hypothetical protein